MNDTPGADEQTTFNNDVDEETTLADIGQDAQKKKHLSSTLLPAGKLGELTRERKLLLIVAYMRTGSTLMGKVFEQLPGALFGFEPLRAVHDEFTNGDSENVTLKYPNKTQR